MQFNVTLEQANLIVAALSKLPFEVSANLISELQTQAQPQIAELEAKAKAAQAPGEPE